MKEQLAKLCSEGDALISRLMRPGLSEFQVDRLQTRIEWISNEMERISDILLHGRGL